MNSKPVVTKDPLDDDITPEEIQKLIDEAKEDGGTCEVVTENDKRFLVCRYPPV